jgi:hypothetical protein
MKRRSVLAPLASRLVLIAGGVAIAVAAVTGFVVRSNACAHRWASRQNLIVALPNPDTVRQLEPSVTLLKQPPRGQHGADDDNASRLITGWVSSGWDTFDRSGIRR